MDRKILPSIVAIPAGWLVTVGAYVVTMVAVGILYSDPFKPAVQRSVGWLLVALAVGSVCSILGGFLTGVIAQRREVAHAAGLVLFGLLVSTCFSTGHWNATPMPTWYMVAAYASTVLSTLLGGWLRMKQRTLLGRGSEAVIKATDDARFVMAAIIAFVTFLLVLFLGTVLGGAGLWWTVRLLFGNDAHTAPTLLPMFVVSLILASVLARRLFKRIIGVGGSLLSGGAVKDGK